MLVIRGTSQEGSVALGSVLSDAGAVQHWRGGIWSEAQAALVKKLQGLLLARRRGGWVVVIFALAQSCFRLCLGMMKERSFVLLCHNQNNLP